MGYQLIEAMARKMLVECAAHREGAKDKARLVVKQMTKRK
jgi:hypothetical protein